MVVAVVISFGYYVARSAAGVGVDGGGGGRRGHKES